MSTKTPTPGYAARQAAKVKRIALSPFNNVETNQLKVVDEYEDELAAEITKRTRLGEQKTQESQSLNKAQRFELLGPLVNGATFPLPIKTLSDAEAAIHLIMRFSPEIMEARGTVLALRNEAFLVQEKAIVVKLAEAKAALNATQSALANS